MAIPVKLEVFEGPLDLLLHLIEKNKIDIYDIPIALITEQYMEYLREMEKQDLDNMSEFLVMAATLLKIKSRMLLPKEETEEEEPEDPRQELVERLLEYKMYKFMSLELDADKMLFKKSTLPPEVADYKEEIHLDELLGDLTLSKLNDIFRSVMKKQVDKIDPVRSTFGKIEKEEVNLSVKMRYVQEYGLEHKTFSFRKLLEEQSDKMELIVTFLCILELMKMGRVHIVQEEIFDDILIEYLANDVIEIDESQL